jgi:hypothetical protein
VLHVPKKKKMPSASHFLFIFSFIASTNIYPRASALKISY